MRCVLTLVLLLPCVARADLVLKTQVGDVDTQIFIPDSDQPLRAIIVHAANYRLTDSDRWAELCRQMNLAHVAMNIPNVQKATSRGNKLHTALHQGLREFAEQSGRKELMQIPFAGTGHSAGGLVTGVLLRSPERTITNCVDCGWVMDSTKLTPEARQTPALFTLGAIPDAFKMLPAIEQYYEPARKAGLPWGLGVQWGCAHDFGNSAAMMVPWIATLIDIRVPADMDAARTPPGLRQVKIEEGWLGDRATIDSAFPSIAAWTQYSGDRAAAVWLPDRRCAHIWRAWQAREAMSLSARAGEFRLPPRNPKKANDLMVAPGIDVELSLNVGGAGASDIRYFDGDIELGGGPAFTWRAPARGWHVVYAQYTDATGKPAVTNPALIIVRQQ